MTTVGYGDKTPKSVQARIFSIIWIIIGIATFSLITAALTSVIVAMNSAPPPTMEDANVGVLNNHLYESILVANQGNFKSIHKYIFGCHTIAFPLPLFHTF